MELIGTDGKSTPLDEEELEELELDELEEDEELELESDEEDGREEDESLMLEDELVPGFGVSPAFLFMATTRLTVKNIMQNMIITERKSFFMLSSLENYFRVYELNIRRLTSARRIALIFPGLRNVADYKV